MFNGAGRGSARFSRWAIGAVLLFSVGCAESGGEGDGGPVPYPAGATEAGSTWAPLPPGTYRGFQGVPSVLGDYELMPSMIYDGEARVSVWDEEAARELVASGELDPEADPERYEELVQEEQFIGVEGDTFAYDGKTITFVKIVDDAETPYLELSISD